MRINLNIEVSEENKIKKTMSQYNPTVNLNKIYRFTKNIDLQKYRLTKNIELQNIKIHKQCEELACEPGAAQINYS